MKHLALAAAACVALVGCTNNATPVKQQSAPVVDAQRKHNHNQQTHRHHHRGERPHAPTYQCEQNIAIVAERKSDDIVRLTVNAPTLNLTNQAIELKQVSAGSGERFLNDTNPASVYEWHSKGPGGIFTVTVQGQEYEYKCQATARPAPAHAPR